MTDSKDILSRNLRMYLSDKMVSITDFSNRTGISRSTLTSIYYGKTVMVKFDTLDKIARNMGCPVDRLFIDRR